MKITIFGATSATGKQLVEKALHAGHDVRAFVRESSKLGIQHEKLSIMTGNALNAARVENAIHGCDAVLSALGPRGKPAVMAAESTLNIVKAMEQYGGKRLVLVSVAGISVPQDRRGFDPLAGLIKLLLKSVFLDRENQLKILETSKVEWVAVRVPRLTDDAGTGSVTAFFGKPSPTMKVTRSDLADFMLKQLTTDEWLYQAPIVRN